MSPVSLYGVLMTGTVLPGLGCNPAAKKSAESGGPIVFGVRPIAGVELLPLMKLVAVTVANPDNPDPPGHVPRATVGPPVNVIQFASAVTGYSASKTAVALIALVMLKVR